MEPETPEIRAERALLGAALLAPHQVERLAPWLPAGCFRQPHHAELWSAMVHTDRADHGPQWPTVMLRTMREAGHPEHVHGGPRLHTYMQACPDPRNAPLYAGMVVEAAVHRAMASHGVHLRQVAACARPATIELDMAEVGATAARVARLAPAWDAVPAPVRERLDPARPPHSIAWPDTPRLVRAHADPRAERALLAGVLADPSAARTHGWIRSDDFALPEHGAMWTAIGDLARTGTPVDPVTVSWQLTRRGPVTEPLAGEDLLAWAREGSAPGAHIAAVAVATGAARDRVDLAGRRLEVLGGAAAVPPSRLLAEAARSVGPAAREVEHLAEHLPARELTTPTRKTTIAPRRPVARRVEAAPAHVREGPVVEPDIDEPDIDI